MAAEPGGELHVEVVQRLPPSEQFGWGPRGSIESTFDVYTFDAHVEVDDGGPRRMRHP